MKLFISKENFAGLKGFENFKDFADSVRKNKNKITDNKINEAFELIKRHSR